MKTIPTVSHPEGVCGFNGTAKSSYQISRKEAAKALWHVRNPGVRSLCRMKKIRAGCYEFSALDTLILNTK
ncbi:hypothetical protein [Rhodoferax antarcticus]|uniref:Uncharacterized protein n=1 Tax=Rhodoferax antarcticus ANT.BR TaxID=1111071 RepID=A0A1Q8Y8Z8_9BURK|nr:hypothetical protein [Rhodoferax antarcticus]OLP04526.1 hypothetical protein BLL52_4311 [Rhodoferax antarcticus ANT.BR]